MRKPSHAGWFVCKVNCPNCKYLCDAIGNLSQESFICVKCAKKVYIYWKAVIAK